MLPFLKPKAAAGLIISHRKPDSSKPVEPDHMEGEENQALESAAADLMRAITSKDEKAFAAAFRAAYEILCSEEAKEGEDYDSQNAKATESAEE